MKRVGLQTSTVCIQGPTSSDLCSSCLMLLSVLCRQAKAKHCL